MKRGWLTQRVTLLLLVFLSGVIKADESEYGIGTVTIQHHNGDTVDVRQSEEPEGMPQGDAWRRANYKETCEADDSCPTHKRNPHRCAHEANCEETCEADDSCPTHEHDLPPRVYTDDSETASFSLLPHSIELHTEPARQIPNNWLLEK